MLPQVVEDVPYEIETPRVGHGTTPISMFLVPSLLRLTQSPHVPVRRLAVACLNQMARDMPRGIHHHMDA